MSAERDDMKKLASMITAVGLALSAFAGPAFASIVITGTRVIYPADEREVTVNISNNSTGPRMVQAWVDSGDDTQTADTAQAPFLLTPPLTRVEAGRGQSFRLMHLGDEYPRDRESVYWLNVLEVPPKPATEEGVNRLQFALRTRIKILLRPTELSGDPLQSLDQLQWRVKPTDGGYVLESRNPSAYTVSFNRLRLSVDGRDIDAGNGMVAARETNTFPLPGLTGMPATASTLDFSAVNDYGGSVDRQATILP
jgi:chaperone protein EcpD